MSAASAAGRVAAREVSELLTWCRRLTVAGPNADPAERAAYLTAKTDLLTRITDRHNHEGDHDGRDQEQR